MKRLRLADESGIALILTMGILLVTSFMLVGVIQYSSDAAEVVRAKAVSQWLDLVKSGKLPPKGK